MIKNVKSSYLVILNKSLNLSLSSVDCLISFTLNWFAGSFQGIGVKIVIINQLNPDADAYIMLHSRIFVNWRGESDYFVHLTPISSLIWLHYGRDYLNF